MGKSQGKSQGKSRRIDITGQRFHSLVVIKYKCTEYRGSVSESHPLGHATAIYECLCDCGKRINVCGRDLRRGHTKSCGCLANPVLTGTQGDLTIGELVGH